MCFDDVASQCQVYIALARHIIGSHLTRENRVTNLCVDDVAPGSFCAGPYSRTLTPLT
jgi:hypothetical protein